MTTDGSQAEMPVPDAWGALLFAISDAPDFIDVQMARAAALEGIVALVSARAEANELVDPRHLELLVRATYSHESVALERLSAASSSEMAEAEASTGRQYCTDPLDFS
jgi:hypothetical protein